MLEQTKAPIIETLKNCAQKLHAPFYAPGHKQGKGIPQPMIDLLGTKVFRVDLPELPELDNLFAPESVIQEAQELAAETFGALHTRFLVNGSTVGIIAGILATCGSGDKIILPRNIHQSIVSGLILSGAIPIFIHPEYDYDWDMALSVTPESVAQALAKHPDAKAVIMVYPTYHGICGDIVAIAQQVHKYDIPLLVDEAHGPHFAFHPELPTPALTSGADLTVQSIHKVLGAMTQASMLHIGSKRIDLYRLSQALQMLQSSSPNYLLLASLDAARQQMALFGEELMSQTLRLANDTRNRISQLPNFAVFENSLNLGFVSLDQTRLTIKVSDMGLSGYEADQILHQELGVTCELPSLKHLTFIISLGNTKTDIEHLITALVSLSDQSYEGKVDEATKLELSLIDFAMATSPRDAFFAHKYYLPIAESVGFISGELICPYPPGIPVLIPGEIITKNHLKILEQVQGLGGIISGCSDPIFQNIKVCKVKTTQKGFIAVLT